MGYFKYKPIKQYMIKCLLSETMGVTRILIRVREGKAGIFQKKSKEKKVGFARQHQKARTGAAIPLYLTLRFLAALAEQLTKM